MHILYARALGTLAPHNLYWRPVPMRANYFLSLQTLASRAPRGLQLRTASVLDWRRWEV